MFLTKATIRANLECTWKYLIALFFIIFVISLVNSAGANSTASANSTVGKIVINEMLPIPTE